MKATWADTTRARRDLETSASSIPVKRNFAWVFSGNVAYSASQGTLLLVLTRISTPEILGRYALALAVCGPIMLLCNLGLRVVQATDAQNRNRFSDFLFLRLLTSAAALAIIAGIAFLGYSMQLAMVILAVGLSKAVESISDILFGLMQKHERMEYIGLSQIAKGPLSIIAFGAVLYVSGQLVWSVLALAGVWLLLLLFFDARNARRFLSAGQNFAEVFWSQARRRDLVSLAARAAPLGYVAVLVSLNWSVPRYFLERLYGESTLGYFAAMAFLPSAGMFALEALGQSAVPRLARHFLKEPSTFRRLVLRLLGMATAIGVAGVLTAAVAGRLLLHIMFGPAYAQHAPVLVWMMAAGGAIYMCSILGVALTAAQSLKIQPPILSVVITSNVLANWLWVPRHGMMGAAWALILAAGIWVMLAWTALLRAITRRRAAAGQLGYLETPT